MSSASAGAAALAPASSSPGTASGCRPRATCPAGRRGDLGLDLDRIGRRCRPRRGRVLAAAGSEHAEDGPRSRSGPAPAQRSDDPWHRRRAGGAAAATAASAGSRPGRGSRDGGGAGARQRLRRPWSCVRPAEPCARAPAPAPAPARPARSARTARPARARRWRLGLGRLDSVSGLLGLRPASSGAATDVRLRGRVDDRVGVSRSAVGCPASAPAARRSVERHGAPRTAVGSRGGAGCGGRRAGADLERLLELRDQREHRVLPLGRVLGQRRRSASSTSAGRPSTQRGRDAAAPRRGGRTSPRPRSGRGTGPIP